MRAIPQSVRLRRGIDRSRRGITIAEVLVTIGIVGLLLSLLMPAVLRSRERERSLVCRNHLKQIALAAHSHQASHAAFPYTSTLWEDIAINPPKKYLAISPHRHLVAHLEPTHYRKIDFNDPTAPVWAAFPPNQFLAAGHRELQEVRIPTLVCPSDDSAPGATSYRANMGISVDVWPPSSTVESISQRGAFVNGQAVSAASFSDGLSNTALFSERVLGDRNPAGYDPFRDVFATGSCPQGTPNLVAHCRQTASLKPPYEYSFLGGSWLLGGWSHSGYNHVLTPNSTTPDCGYGPGCVDGGATVMSARSFHEGGVNVAMADGAVRFVASTIDIEVWHAFGTRNGHERTSGL